MAISDLLTHSSAPKRPPASTPPVARSSTLKTRAFGQKSSPTLAASKSANPPPPPLSLIPLLRTVGTST
jgi:hypothetical protein